MTAPPRRARDMTPQIARALLRALFDAAVAAAMPGACVKQALPAPPKGRTIVVGAGKASAEMARALEENWPGALSGLVVTRYGHGAECRRIEVVEAGHPVPDAAGVKGARRMLRLIEGLSADDLVIALISGGGSALLTLPAAGLTLKDKRAVNRALLAGGVPIDEMNCVRKHLSAIKGGRLAAAAYPARVVSLVISDVPGDDLAVVASGPTVADKTTFADARAVLARHRIEVPPEVSRHLDAAEDETPKPGDPRLARAETKLIASPQMSLEAAATLARAEGVTPLILGDALEGEARQLGAALAGIARHAREFGQPAKPPCVILSGGETTVTVKGKGVGGRNVECLLGLAIKLQGADSVYALAADTDGVDGAREVAGAFVDPTTLTRAREKGIDPWRSLEDNDAHSFFEAIGDQLVTGPTRTNVNDFRAQLVLGR